MKMTLTAVLIDALHAALEDREITFDGVGGDIAAHPLVFAVIDALVASEVTGLVHVFVPAGLVGHHVGVVLDVGADDRDQSADGRAVHVEAAGRSAALDKGQYDVAAVRAATGLRTVLLAADDGLVDFDHGAVTAHRRQSNGLHRQPDTVRHKPSGLEGHAEGARELV